MKTIKSILIAATLIGATVVSTMSAQQAPAQKHEFRVAIGDSVMIKRECQKYCTGETPSVWVWDKVHTVRQLGTKRFADGVLLMNIYSWMCEDCLIPVNGRAKEAAAQAAEEQAADRAAFEAGKSLEEIAAEKAAAEEVAEEPAEVAVEEPAEEPVEEPAEEPVEETAKKAKSAYDRFTIGVRGGVASQLHNAVDGVDAKWGIGGDAILDLQYAHYWTKEGRSTDLGLIVGLGVGYAQGSFKGAENSNFKLGGLDYSITASDIRETDHQLQLEIPLMFSLIHQSGLFFNVGPRFMMPVYTPFNEKINGSAIQAHDPETDVTWVDNIITGKYNGETAEGSNNLQFKFHIMLTAEIGYEWILKSGNSLGLGVFADYSVYNTRPKQDTRKYNSLVDVTAPGNGELATVVARPVTDAYAKSTGFFDVGVKLAYHFNFPKKQKAAKVEAAEIAPAAE
jgi:hypothetical protein